MERTERGGREDKGGIWRGLRGMEGKTGGGGCISIICFSANLRIIHFGRNIQGTIKKVLEVKLPYDPVCPSVCRSVGRSVG